MSLTPGVRPVMLQRCSSLREEGNVAVAARRGISPPHGSYCGAEWEQTLYDLYLAPRNRRLHDPTQELKPLAQFKLVV